MYTFRNPKNNCLWHTDNWLAILASGMSVPYRSHTSFQKSIKQQESLPVQFSKDRGVPLVKESPTTTKRRTDLREIRTNALKHLVRTSPVRPIKEYHWSNSHHIPLLGQFMIGHIKMDLRGGKFDGPEEVGIQRSIRTISELFWQRIWKKLRSHLDHVIGSHGDYVSRIHWTFVHLYKLPCFIRVISFFLGYPSKLLFFDL